jgi:hypothetical protein
MQPPEFLLIAGILVAGTSIVRPIAKAMAVRLSRGGGDDTRLRELEAELRLNRQQLLETREQVERMAEKVHFVENLLGEPAGVPGLPPSRR